MDSLPSDQRQAILRRNRQTYDVMVDRRAALCRVATPEELAQPLKTVDVVGWLGDSIAGEKVLCLAAGGGRQSALYAAAGAQVTVVDISPAMLELDRRVAHEHGFNIRILEASMDDLSGLSNDEFDLVIHPVSTCYLPSVTPVFSEVRRVLRAGGLYVSQHKTPTSLQTSTTRDTTGSYSIRHAYYRDTPVPDPDSVSSNSRRLRESGAVEFLHRWEEIVGGMCRVGFVIEDLIEPLHVKSDSQPDTFGDRAKFVAPYVRIKARRRSDGGKGNKSDTKLWLPRN
ncbi:MAG: class I SAM-dependent methyltransferase [Planctomycetota bacterium]